MCLPNLLSRCALQSVTCHDDHVTCAPLLGAHKRFMRHAKGARNSILRISRIPGASTSVAKPVTPSIYAILHLGAGRSDHCTFCCGTSPNSPSMPRMKLKTMMKFRIIDFHHHDADAADDNDAALAFT
eukprot:4268368-Amphidinium_carterae.1